MNKTTVEKYRSQLRDLADRVDATAASLEDGARSSAGGDATGNLSGTPLHLADLGSDEYNQELNATLFENEAYIRDEVTAALGRADAGTFGACENCQQSIPAERLDALPYTRYCVACAEKAHDGPAVNLNTGRPVGRRDRYNHRPDTDRANAPFRPRGDVVTFTDMEAAEEGRRQGSGDTHAAGTAGGGTAVGGLAGTNIGHGDPANADLENALGSGRFDTDIAGDDSQTDGYAGPTGGAVGGTPAGKRATGGRTGKGYDPHPGRGDSPTGQ